MISKETIDKVLETAHIEEVVSDFVTLKKAGVNLKGLCPFHNEKTPSFVVSPSKEIYKCFGCGESGNAVNFLMKHEQLTYPEAVKYLAKKYHIEIEEALKTAEDSIAQHENESLFIISSFAQQYFSNLLFNTDEGKTIGYSYFKERGFNEDIIKKFQLGYSVDKWDAFTMEALGKGFLIEILEKSGLSILKEGKEEPYDRFRGRVIFPIHNLSGRVIAFGARILKDDPKSPKYVNSPETSIYHKGKGLYGIFFAKSSIKKEDNCLLVEGYTDVISLHQAGIENVVASSGTSLTEDQIRSIQRFTSNITILYDGDEAGIKASSRGVDMILEQDLNVKIVLFPDKEDPDSYVRRIGGTLFKQFIADNAKDFVIFKTLLLSEDARKDPIKKAEAIQGIVETLSRISNHIKRSLYIKECSTILNISEEVLVREMNRVIIRKNKNSAPVLADKTVSNYIKDEEKPGNYDYEEQEVIRLLLSYPTQEIYFNIKESGMSTTQEKTYKAAQYIVEELKSSKITFENKLYTFIINEFEEHLSKGEIIDAQYFSNHQNPDISQLAGNIIALHHHLSENWDKKYDIHVPRETEKLKYAIYSALSRLKVKQVKKMITENLNKIKYSKSQDEQLLYQKVQMKLNDYLKQLSSPFGTVVVK